MATATATATLDTTIHKDVSERYFGVYYTVAISASPDTYANTGLTLNLAKPGVPANAVPAYVRVWSEDPADGYDFKYQRGSRIDNGLLFIMASVTVANGTGPGLVNMTNGTAIPAAISGDTKLRAFALFVKK